MPEGGCRPRLLAPGGCVRAPRADFAAVENRRPRMAAGHLQRDVYGAAGGLGDLFGEAGRSGVRHRIGAEVTGELALLLRAGQRDDLGSGLLGQLDGERADSTRGGGDHDRLSRLQFGGGGEEVPG